MIVKVKEPQPNECRMERKRQILFAYPHLAPDSRQTEWLVDSGAIAIAYGIVVGRDGGFPLLAPMSEVAGRMPSGVARTSTLALNYVTLPYTLALVDKGYRQALLDDVGLLAGLNVHYGSITYEAVANDLG